MYFHLIYSTKSTRSVYNSRFQWRTILQILTSDKQVYIYIYIYIYYRNIVLEQCKLIDFVSTTGIHNVRKYDLQKTIL